MLEKVGKRYREIVGDIRLNYKKRFKLDGKKIHVNINDYAENQEIFINKENRNIVYFIFLKFKDLNEFIISIRDGNENTMLFCTCEEGIDFTIVNTNEHVFLLSHGNNQLVVLTIDFFGISPFRANVVIKGNKKT